MNYLLKPEVLWQQLSAVVEDHALQTKQPKLQILEVGAKTADLQQAESAYQQFLAGHIADAQFVDLNRYFCRLNTDLEYQCPNVAELSASLQHFGLDFSQPMIIYDRDNHIWAARLFWVLRAYGHQHVSVLHQGLAGWQQANYPLQIGDSPALQQFKAMNFELNPQYFADLALVKKTSEQQHDAQLLNVLRRPVFNGEELRYARAGHIPYSINLPFADFLDKNGQFKPLNPAFLTDLGLDLHREIIIYCGSGVTASGAALALLLAGASAVKIYDGSMAEWSANPNLPLNVLI